MKRIYFAGSIRGGREDAPLYGRIIKHIQKTDIVLTWHVGNPDVLNHEHGLSPGEIYSRDIAWLRGSDMVIAECTAPSLGVGYELAFARQCGIPCHIFYNSGKVRLSAMLAGDPYFKIHPYTDEDEIYPVIDGLLQMK